MAAGGEQAQRIAFVAQSAGALFENHRRFLEALHARGCELCLLAPKIEPKLATQFSALGGSYVAFQPELSTWWPFGSRGVVKDLAKHLADWSTDAVAGIGYPWIWLAARAGKWAKIPKVVSIVEQWPDAGNDSSKAFGNSEHDQLTQGLQASTHVVVHNKEIERGLNGHEAISSGALSLVCVPGGGVDLSEVSCQPLPSLDKTVTFGMSARLEAGSGVMVFGRAAEAVLQVCGSDVAFRLAYQPGKVENDDTAIAAETLEPLADVMSITELDGRQSELEETARCHVFVYPSAHEGMPRSVLQALAVGRPVIASSGAGCRETVDERVNGCLIADRDARGLAKAMKSFVDRPELLPSMARASRQKAERHFSDTKVVAQLLSVFGYNS